MLTLDIISRKGSSSWFGDKLWIFVVPQNFPGDNPVGYSFWYTSFVNLWLIFRKIAKNLSNYSFMSMMTTALPLSWFIIAIFWLFDKFLILSQCFYDTFIPDYFWEVFLNFDFILQRLASGKSSIFLSKFWNSVYIKFLLVLIGTCFSSSNESVICSFRVN